MLEESRTRQEREITLDALAFLVCAQTCMHIFVLQIYFHSHGLDLELKGIAGAENKRVEGLPSMHWPYFSLLYNSLD